MYEPISDANKEGIRRMYVHKSSLVQVGDQVKEVKERVLGFLESNYRAWFGENWKDVLGKYDYLDGDDRDRVDSMIDFYQLHSYFPDNFPISESPLTEEQRRDLLKDLEAINEAKELYSHKEERAAKKKLSRIKTYQDLKDKAPEIFNFHIKTLLGIHDQVILVTREEDTRLLKNFLGQ